MAQITASLFTDIELSPARTKAWVEKQKILEKGTPDTDAHIELEDTAITIWNQQLTKLVSKLNIKLLDAIDGMRYIDKLNQETCGTKPTGLLGLLKAKHHSNMVVYHDMLNNFTCTVHQEDKCNSGPQTVTKDSISTKVKWMSNSKQYYHFH
jgi:hypothetical protein